MNRVKGCFITIVSIFVLIVLILLCVTLIDTGSPAGEGKKLAGRSKKLEAQDQMAVKDQ